MMVIKYITFYIFADTMSKNVKLISLLTAFLALLFLSVVPQLAYRYSNHFQP